MIIRLLSAISILVGCLTISSHASDITKSAPEPVRVCSSYSLDSLVKEIPFFSEKMSRKASSNDVITLVHNDDARIQAVFKLVNAQEEPASRSTFLRRIKQGLEAAILHSRQKSDMIYNVYPNDPIAWSLVNRITDSQGDKEIGNLTIRLSSLCYAVVEWSVLKEPLLQTRIQETSKALDQFRSYMLRHIDKNNVFLPDSYTPYGWVAFVVGVICPLIASILLMIVLRSMILFDKPNAIVRILIGFGVIATIAAGYMQLPAYLEGFTEYRYMENAMLLAMTFAITLPATIIANQKTALAALTVMVCAGFSTTFAAWLGWSPIVRISLYTGIALFLCGVAGIVLWHANTSIYVRKDAQRKIKVAS